MGEKSHDLFWQHYKNQTRLVSPGYPQKMLGELLIYNRTSAKYTSTVLYMLTQLFPNKICALKEFQNAENYTVHLQAYSYIALWIKFFCVVAFCIYFVNYKTWFFFKNREWNKTQTFKSLCIARRKTTTDGSKRTQYE